MKILVTAKQVPDVQLKIRTKDGEVSKDGLQYVINAWDESAIEEAVRIKEKDSADVDVLSIGNDSAQDIIRKALALGADNGIHVALNQKEFEGTTAISKIIAKVFEKGGYDLLIMGKQSQDSDSGQTGIITAAMLDLPCVSNAVKIEINDKNAALVRDGDNGHEKIDTVLPLVITVSDSINEPRLANLRGIMQAKKKPLDQISLADLGLDEVSLQSEEKAYELIESIEPEGRKSGLKFEGDLNDAVKQVTDILNDEAKVF